MSYLVLARKYRPQALTEVIGQEAVIKPINQAIDNNRIAHAFLLTGSRGVGKTTIARALAKSLVCQKGISLTPCQECAPCTGINTDSALDVIEIDGASNTGVDDIRELRETIQYQPTNCRYKVIIIDEVHMLSNNAFNALLKTLEEPPDHVKFIFATTEAHKIPATILSRCQRYDLKNLRREVIENQLSKILKNENQKLDSRAIALIAEAAKGSMRDALSLLDQAIAFSEEDTPYETIVEILGIVEKSSIFDMSIALAKKDLPACLKIITQVFERGADHKVFLEGIATTFRHMCVASLTASLIGYADVSEEEAQSLEKNAQLLNSQEWQRLFSMTLKAIGSLSGSENSELHIELFCLQVALRPALQEAQTIYSAIAELKSLTGESVALSKTASHTSVQTTKPQNTLKDMDQGWLKCVKLLHEKSRILGSHLEHGHLLRKEKQSGGTVIYLSFDNKVHHHAVDQELKNPDLANVLAQCFGDGSRLSITLAGDTVETKQPVTTIQTAKEATKQAELSALYKRAQSDPLISQTLKSFGGEIKSVQPLP